MDANIWTIYSYKHLYVQTVCVYKYPETSVLAGLYAGLYADYYQRLTNGKLCAMMAA